MITIIKPGTTQKGRCKYCGCLFSYEKEDVKIKNRTSSSPLFAVQVRYITCPQCKEEIVLEATR